jgi:hypothetical protein
MYSLYKKSSKKRGYDFFVDKELFVRLLLSPCHYCGLNASEAPSNRNGLDRVDSSIGYIAENVVPCCFRCNQMKGRLSYKDFLNQIKRIHNHVS